jgi:2-oxoglutarate ferredoxin oxidoreductase subunit delta
MPERVRHAPLDLEKVRPLKAEIHLIKDECKGCGYCIQFCPMKLLEESQEINARGVHPPRIVNESKCTICSFCSAVCPDFAIFVVEKEKKEGK